METAWIAQTLGAMSCSGAELARARREQHLTLDQLAGATGVTVADLVLIELDEPGGFASAADLDSALQAYAAGVGLDPDVVSRDYLPQVNAGPDDEQASPVATEPARQDPLDEFPSETRGRPDIISPSQIDPRLKAERTRLEARCQYAPQDAPACSEMEMFRAERELRPASSEDPSPRHWTG